MCLIVFKENTESTFSNKQFKSMIRRNRDGLGIMWRENGRVLVEKSVADERSKFALWHKHRDREQYAMHARLTTHGKTNEDNCHPYKVLSIDDGDAIDLYMMHNGVITNAPDVDKAMSDTWHFVEYIIKPIAKTNLPLLWDNDPFQQWLQKSIGASKLLFMRSDDVQFPTLILNSSMGKEETGCWLSNTYSTDTAHSYYTPKKAGLSHHNQNFTRKTTTTTESSTTGTTGITTIEPGPDYVKLGDQFKDAFPNLVKAANGFFLPNRVPFAVPEIKSEAPDAALVEIVSTLKGMSLHNIKEWIREDPDLCADVILALYEKNTMPYELIVQQIADDKGIEGIVDIIRHITSFNKAPIKNYCFTN